MNGVLDFIVWFLIFFLLFSIFPGFAAFMMLVMLIILPFWFVGMIFVAFDKDKEKPCECKKE